MTGAYIFHRGVVRRRPYASVRTDMKTSLFPFAAMLLVTGCGGDDGAGAPTSPDGGQPVDGAAPASGAPRFLSFGTNVTTITENESIVFTAVLTDPDGIDDLIGGSLTSADGTVQYGGFATSGQEGSYTLTLLWNQLHQVDDITFGTKESRELRAAFFDVAGNEVERRLTIDLSCGGEVACSGRCVSVCSVTRPERLSCADACPLYHGATCNAADSDRRAYYRLAAEERTYGLATCTTVPPQTQLGFTFAAVECECIPGDP